MVLQEEASVAPVEEQEIEPVAPVVPEIPVLVQRYQRPTSVDLPEDPCGLSRGKPVAALVGAGVSTTRSLVVMGLAPRWTRLVLIGGTSLRGGADLAGPRGAAECRLSKT